MVCLKMRAHMLLLEEDKDHMLLLSQLCMSPMLLVIFSIVMHGIEVYIIPTATHVLLTIVHANYV